MATSVLQATAKTGHQRRVTNYTVNEGRQWVLPCDHTRSVPRATVTWYTVGCARGCNDKRVVALNERITIDDNGKRYELRSVVSSHCPTERD